MSELRATTNKEAYEARRADGQIYGAIAVRDWDRFRQTLRFVPNDTRSLLDAGCDRGHWLSYVQKHRAATRLVGIDVAEGRIREAQERYPGIEFRAQHLEDVDPAHEAFDVVTSLEVLEHVPDWMAVLDSLLCIARRRVLITVPYREQIQQTNCIHCGKLTPMYGHLRSYDESSFPEREGWQRGIGYVMDHGIGATLARRIYRTLRPLRSWLVVCYDARA